MDKEPTQEQVREFWESCGLFYGWSDNPETMEQEGGWYVELQTPTACMLISNKLPDIDLNNLFKYAVPKAIKYLNAQSEIDGIDTVKYPFHDLMRRWVYATAIKNEDPALALFWALWQVIRGGRNDG